MSDEEYEYDYGSDADYDYGSDGDEEGGDDELIEIENSYYEGDDCKYQNPLEAVRLFERVVEMETNRGEDVVWRFKALRNLVVLYFSLDENSKMLERYRLMLSYMNKVTRNDCTDAINVVLDTLQTAKEISNLSEMYEVTLDALKSANNERLWFNTNLKLAKLYMDTNKINDVERILLLLKSSCQHPDGSDDISKGTYLLEVYCLEIQLCTLTQDPARMRQIYPRTLNLNAAVSDPRIMGVIREEGGKMYMIEGQWKEAYDELFEAFRAYQQAGNSRAKSCLKYVVLASMLALSDINPFSAREAKVYADDKEILAMSQLRQSLEANDLKRFERIIRDRSNRICDEPFLMTYIDSLRRRMREQALLSLTKPYQKVSLAYLGQELSLEVSDVESLLVDLIMDDKLEGNVDQVNGNVVLSRKDKSLDLKKLQAIEKYADAERKVLKDFPFR